MPAIFETAIIQNSSSVGTIASLVFNPANTSATTFGPLGSVPSTALFKDVMFSNVGTANVYLNYSSQSAAAANGVLCPVGGGVIILGLNAGTATANQVWGQTGTAGLTGAVSVGLLSVGVAGVI